MCYMKKIDFNYQRLKKITVKMWNYILLDESTRRMICYYDIFVYIDFTYF